MIRKSVQRFSEKIMRNKGDDAPASGVSQAAHTNVPWLSGKNEWARRWPPHTATP
jgi:hypothetical protein